MDRAARKNFFDNAAVFRDRAGRGAKLDSAEATELPFSAQKLI